MDPSLLETSIALGVDEIEFTLRGTAYTLPCDVVLDVDPGPRLSFQITGLDTWLAWTHQETVPVYLKTAGARVEAFVGAIKNGTVSLCPTREPIAVGTAKDLVEVRFDLLNFPTFFAMESDSARLPDDHLDISTTDWQIEIRPPRSGADIEVFRSPLYRVTHSCWARRNDGAAFSSVAARKLLNVMHEAMSFTAGQWVAPVFVDGRNGDGRSVWKEWGTRPLHPRLGRVVTWFDAHHGDSLAELVPRALELYQDSGRTETFHSALYWYLRATGLAAGVDGGIILLQAALERLSWQRFVLDREALSQDGFTRLAAEDQIRLLLESCRIPMTIPNGLGQLVKKAKELNWNDGPKALTAVRNQLVHPKRGGQLPFPDAWKLAEWYVELVLLHMLGFQGKYFDRTQEKLWVGDVRPVPWAMPQA